MTIWTRAEGAPSERPTMVLAAGAALLGALGVLGTRTPLLLIAAPVGAAAMIYAAMRPAVALIIMVLIEVSNASGVLGETINVPLFAPSMLLGALAIGFGLRDALLRARLNAWTVILIGFVGVFLATQVIAAIGTTNVTASLADLRRNGLDLAFLVVVAVLVQMTARPWTVTAAIVSTLAILGLLTLLHFLFFSGETSFGGFSTVTRAEGELITTPRYAGPLLDSNFWGRHLIMGLPLAAALLTRALRARNRKAVAWWVTSMFFLLAGVYLTQSRGTFLAAGIAIAAWYLVSERSVGRWGLLGLPLGLVVLAVPGIGNRLRLAIEQIASGQDNGSHVDPSLVGRISAQEQAAMMWQERPVFGFGPGTFPSQVPNFAGRVPTAVLAPPDGSHNLYAQLAAESGVVGLLGWAVLILGFISVLVLAIIAAPRSKDRVLAAAACTAIIGWSVASIGLHLAYFRTLTVVMALTAALAPAWPLPATVIRTFTRGVAVWATALVIGFGASFAYFAVASTPASRATQRVTVVPAGPVDGWFSYALDIRSRNQLLTTFAKLLRDPESPITIEADPVRGVMTLTAIAPTATEARNEVALGVSRASYLLTASLGYNQYLLQPLDSMRIEPIREHSKVTIPVAAGIGIATALCSGLALSTLVRRRRPQIKPTVKAPVASGVS